MSLVCLALAGATAVAAVPPLQTFVFSTPAGSAGNPAGVLSSPDGTNSVARFYGPAGLAQDNSGNLFLTDGSSVRKIARSGTNWIVTTLAGIGVGHTAVDGTNSVARFNSPSGVAVDAGGTLYVADTLNHAIRRVVSVGTNWVVTTLAGMTNSPGSADGTNSAATFNTPYGIAVDGATNLYVADTYNNTIRLVRPVSGSWVVSTIAGLAGNSGFANGSNSVARFNAPAAIVVDAQTNLFVADYTNQTIRRITPIGTNWAVTTIAGSVGNSGSADGTNTAARFNQPQALALDHIGNVYVADSGNSTVRQCSISGTNWIVTTVAGTPGVIGSQDGVGINALFNNPWGIVADSSNNLVVLDNYEYTVRFGQVAFNLRINTATNHVQVSWATNATGYRLETSSSPSSGAVWAPITNTITVSGNTYLLNTNLTTGNSFYRLYKP